MLADARVLARPACVPWRASRRSLPVAACSDCRRLGLPVVLKRAPGAEQRRQTAQHTGRRARQGAASHGVAAAPPTSSSGKAESHDLDAFLDTLKWDASGLVVAIAQARARLCQGLLLTRRPRQVGPLTCAHGTCVSPVQNVDTGAIMMQAFANREAVKHTLSTGKVCALPAGAERCTARAANHSSLLTPALRRARRPRFGHGRDSGCGPRASRPSACFARWRSREVLCCTAPSELTIPPRPLCVAATSSMSPASMSTAIVTRSSTWACRTGPAATRCVLWACRQRRRARR
jgi:phosphoribosyl-AMP cyclohydrolase